MKFGKLFCLGAFATALSGGTALASPAYFFGNAPSAAGSFPQGCPIVGEPNCAPSDAKALFLAQVDVTGNETFETRAAGSIEPANSLPVFAAGTLTQGLVPANLLGGVVQSGSMVSGRFNTTNGSTSGKWFESELSFTIDIGGDVGAFAFYGTDFNDFAGGLEIELLNDGVSVVSNAFTQADGSPLPLRGSTQVNDGSLIFFGFGSQAQFDRIVFKVQQPSGAPIDTWDYLGFDDIMVGNLRTTTPNPAPEPGSLALVGLALVAAGWARKAQRRT